MRQRPARSGDDEALGSGGFAKGENGADGFDEAGEHSSSLVQEKQQITNSE